jgi:hypothetical protein
MQTKSSAATTARPNTPTLRDAEQAALARWRALPTTTATTPTTPTQAAALPPAAPSTETTMTMAQIVGRITLKVSAKERPARLAPPQRATRRTPLTRAALATTLPMLETRYERVAGTLRLNDKGGVVSRHPALTPWVTFDPQSRDYSIDRYIDGPGLLALSRKVGAKVVFANATFTALAALTPEQRALRRAARRVARRTEAERLDAERTAHALAAAHARAAALEEEAQRRAERALARNTLKAERTALALDLAGEMGVTTAAARRALLDADWSIEDARNALELAAMKAEERKERKEERKEAADALAAAPAKVKTALKGIANQALKGRIALVLDSLKGRLLGVALKAALAAAATTPDANTTLTTDRLQCIIASAVDEERIRRDLAVERKLKMKAAIKARSEEVTNLFARAKGGDKGVPQALTLAITLARKVRG